jgi:hypothetical protein
LKLTGQTNETDEKEMSAMKGEATGTDGVVARWHHLRVVAVALLLVGCSAAPSQNILGSYFPSWMVCVLIGLGLSAVVHWILVKLDMEKELPAPIMVHLATTIAISFAAWLLWLA